MSDAPADAPPADAPAVEGEAPAVEGEAPPAEGEAPVEGYEFMIIIFKKFTNCPIFWIIK